MAKYLGLVELSTTEASRTLREPAGLVLREAWVRDGEAGNRERSERFAPM